MAGNTSTTDTTMTDKKDQEISANPIPRVRTDKDELILIESDKDSIANLSVEEFSNRVVRSFLTASEEERNIIVDKLSLDFLYQGFDPKKVIQGLKSKATSKKVDDIMKDVVAMVTLCLMRGTKFSSVERRTKSEGIDKLSMLKTTYGLVSSSKTASMDVNAITLSRVCNAFPILVCHVLKNKNIVVKGVIPNGLSKSLCWPGAPAVIPRDWSGVYEYWMDWAISFDLLINSRNVVKKDVRLQNLRSISEAAWNSEFISQKDRLKCMQDIGQGQYGVNQFGNYFGFGDAAGGKRPKKRAFDEMSDNQDLEIVATKRKRMSQTELEQQGDDMDEEEAPED